MSTPNTSRTPRELAMRLAAEAGVDVRTAARAIAEGPEAIRTLLLRERLELGMRTLGIERPAAGVAFGEGPRSR